jgi:predicted deacylase
MERRAGSNRVPAEGMGIRAVTVEFGDPQRLQHKLVSSTRIAIRDVLRAPRAPTRSQA